MRYLPAGAAFTCALALGFAGTDAAFASTGAAYNSIPGPLPGNVPSEAFEATQTAEFGDQAALAGGGGVVKSVDVLLSSWGCESGSWSNADCSTTAGATFSHPITLNLYNVGSGNSVGSLIATKTQTFDIPYRPSRDDVNCTGANAGKWYSAAESHCYNGLATTVTFDFTGSVVTVPANVIVSVAYDTTHYGYNPIGESAACYSSSGGCGYDSLNVGLNTGAPSTGSDAVPDDAYVYGQGNYPYCDSGAGGIDVFRLDAGCWTGYTPGFAVALDRTNPSADLTTPANGATYLQNEVVNADYSCSDDFSLASCVGDVPNADAIDTTSVGPHTFTVTATDSAGNTSPTTHSYTVVNADPTVTITTPEDGHTYYRGSSVTANYNCDDDVQLVSCVGTLADGATINTSTIGGRSFTVTATDNLGQHTVVTSSYQVRLAPTTADLNSPGSPPAYGQTLTLTATISAPAGRPTPTGSVRFTDGTTTLDNVPLNGLGRATLQVSSLSAGTHRIVASYGGDSNNAASSTSVTVVIARAPTTATITSHTPNPSSYGRDVTVDVSVAAQHAISGDVTGHVQLRDGSTLIGSPVALSGGTAEIILSSLTPGGHALTAQYTPADAKSFVSSVSARASQKVVRAATSLSLRSSANPSSLHDDVTFTATVSSSAGTPGGSVQFDVDGAALGSPVALVGGVATIDTSSLAHGGHTIQANYVGNVNFAPRQNSLRQRVN